MFPEIRSADDLRNIEFDWLASDADRHVALFSSAGGGFLPDAVWRHAHAHDAAIEAILALPPSMPARFSPELRAGLRNTWRQVAERGLFAYDSDPNGGPYLLVAAPDVPLPSTEFPAAVTALLGQLQFEHLRFATLGEISAETLQSAR